MMKVLVACEFSGVVRNAFAALGHDAWSCDLLPSELPGNHLVGDALTFLDRKWDLLIAHPPCTHLCVSGARWFKTKRALQEEALDFVAALLHAPVPRIALENPVSVISTRIRPPDQLVHPWQFGHGETKTTCLWPNRSQERSRTFSGIATAMANQWGRKPPHFFLQPDLFAADPKHR